MFTTKGIWDRLHRFLLCLICLFLLISVKNTQAQVFWREDFNGEFDQEWQVFDEYNYLEFTPSTLRFEAPQGHYFPYIYTRERITPEGNYTIRLKIRYRPKNYNFGAGLVLGDHYYSERINYSPTASEIMFQIWPLPANRLGLKSNIASDFIPDCEQGCFFHIVDNEEMFQWQDVAIERKEQKYYIYLNNSLVFESNPTPREIFYIWIGNPEITKTAVVWPIIEIDEIECKHIFIEAFPLIIIPGLGASWNTRAMVYGEEVANNEWRMTPFVNIYNRLIETAKNNGYQLNQNLFVWHYDWRQPLPEIAIKFNEFIENTPQLAEAEKIDLVGHSLGGLVARTWAQNSEDHTNKINKFIAVGSPHQGAVQAYEALAGGKIGDRVNLGWLAMQLLLQIHRQGIETNAAIIRNLAPVLQNITPTFDFLKKYRRIIPVNQTSFFNQKLTSLNQSFNLNQISYFVVGNVGKTTPEWLWLKSRSLLDQILNLWPDGHPYRKINGIGDSTVLVKSARWQDVAYSEFNFNHHQIISHPDSVAKIMELLNKPDAEIAEADPAYPNDNLLVFYLASPATLRVDDYEPDDEGLQFIVIPNPKTKIYQAEILGVDTGSYRLYLGQITPSGNYWQTYKGEIKPGEQKIYQFAIDFDNPEKQPLIDEEGLAHLQEAKWLLEKLRQTTNHRYLNSSLTYLNQALELSGQKNWSQAIDKIKKSLYYLARFQRKLTDSQREEANQAQEIMEILATGWQNLLRYQNLASRAKAYREYRRARAYYSLSVRLLRLAKRKRRSIAEIKAMFINRSKELLTEISSEWRQENYALVESQSYLARLLAWSGFTR